jgi:hypothetical protein
MPVHPDITRRAGAVRAPVYLFPAPSRLSYDEGRAPEPSYPLGKRPASPASNVTYRTGVLSLPRTERWMGTIARNPESQARDAAFT